MTIIDKRKRLNTDEILRDINPDCSANIDPVCGLLKEGQKFATDMTTVPEGFCPSANYRWMNDKGKVLVCCTDGFRPVIFGLERMQG
tara:strand:- start:132 stop:392 length:261 start_codon:yes stop_codon:yes gene_type:complete